MDSLKGINLWLDKNQNVGGPQTPQNTTVLTVHIGYDLIVLFLPGNKKKFCLIEKETVKNLLQVWSIMIKIQGMSCSTALLLSGVVYM